MVEILRHSQTKGRDNRKLKHRPKQARLSSTLRASSEGWCVQQGSNLPGQKSGAP